MDRRSRLVQYDTTYFKDLDEVRTEGPDKYTSKGITHLVIIVWDKYEVESMFDPNIWKDVIINYYLKEQYNDISHLAYLHKFNANFGKPVTTHLVVFNYRTREWCTNGWDPFGPEAKQIEYQCHADVALLYTEKMKNKQ